jgi:hypothetical protein
MCRASRVCVWDFRWLVRFGLVAHNAFMATCVDRLYPWTMRRFLRLLVSATRFWKNRERTFQPSGADQTFYNMVLVRNPWLVWGLPCEWNMHRNMFAAWSLFESVFPREAGVGFE